MGVVAVEECPVVLDVVLRGHAAVDLVAYAAQYKSGWLDKILGLTAVRLGGLDKTVVLSGRGAGDPGVLVVDVSADLLRHVLGGRAASDELVDGGGDGADGVPAVTGCFQIEGRCCIAIWCSQDT